jgi:hypothetical protein
MKSTETVEQHRLTDELLVSLARKQRATGMAAWRLPCWLTDELLEFRGSSTCPGYEITVIGSLRHSGLLSLPRSTGILLDCSIRTYHIGEGTDIEF